MRFSLTQGIAPGSDTRYSDEKTESARNFMNKLWNASRFVLMNIEGVKPAKLGTFRLTAADKWILSELNRTIKEVTKSLDKYEIGMADGKLYDFVWSQFCDWYIELAKTSLYSDDPEKKARTAGVLVHVLETVLKLMHPIVPFITDEIYRNLPGRRQSIMLTDWPEADKKYNYTAERKRFEKVIELIRALRNMKAEKGVAPGKKVNLYLVSDVIAAKDADYVKRLAGVENVTFGAKPEGKVVSLVGAYGSAFVPLGELVDISAEIERLDKQLAAKLAEIERGEKLLANKGFVAKAPKALIDKETAKLAANRQKADDIRRQADALKD